MGCNITGLRPVILFSFRYRGKAPVPYLTITGLRPVIVLVTYLWARGFAPCLRKEDLIL